MFIKVTGLDGVVVHINVHHLIFFYDITDMNYPAAKACIVLTGDPMQKLMIKESSSEISELIRANRRSNLK